MEINQQKRKRSKVLGRLPIGVFVEIKQASRIRNREIYKKKIGSAWIQLLENKRDGKIRLFCYWKWRSGMPIDNMSCFFQIPIYELWVLLNFKNLIRPIIAYNDWHLKRLKLNFPKKLMKAYNYGKDFVRGNFKPKWLKER